MEWGTRERFILGPRVRRPGGTGRRHQPPTDDGGLYAGAARQYYSCNPDLYGERTVPLWNDTPYFIMKAPASFIRDHDDVFQRGLYNFLLLMMGEDRTFEIR